MVDDLDSDFLAFWFIEGAAGAAGENRQVVAEQLAAAAAENGRSAGEARPVLLAAAGEEPSNAPPLRVHGRADRAAGPTDGIAELPTSAEISDQDSAGEGSVSGRNPERPTIEG